MNPGFGIDLLWTMEYPLTIIMAFLAFFLPLRKKKNFVVFLLLGIILLFGVSLFKFIPELKGNDVFNISFYFVNFIIAYFMIHFSLDGMSFSGELLILSCVIALQHVAYKITTGIFIIIGVELIKVTAIYLPAAIGILAILCVASYFLFAKKVTADLLSENSLISVVGITLLSVMCVVVNYFTFDIIFLDAPNIKLMASMMNLTGLLVTILVLAFIFIATISNKRKEENALLSMIDSKDKDRYELAKISIDEINIKYHDLSHILKDNKLDPHEAEEIKETLTNYKTFINTSNKGLNVVIYEYQLVCIKKEIDFKVLIDGEALSFMKSHHVYSLLSNLISNAIEATDKIEDVDKRRITLNISKKQDNVIININNFSTEKIKFSNGIPVTTKNDKKNHGFGIRSVIRTVNLYDGNITFNYKDDKFSVIILLPFPLNQKEK